MTTSAVTAFAPLIEGAPTPSARAAATVVAAAALMEAARPDEALTLIQATLDYRDSTPVDHAWLTVRYARACMDLGRFDEARVAAETVQTIRLTHAHDVTATAIAGTAALLLFILADLGTGNTAAAVSGMDTTAVWWRFQNTAPALPPRSSGSSRPGPAAVSRSFPATTPQTTSWP